MSKRIYINAGLITHSVKSETIITDSNYNTSIQIKMVGFNFPIWGTVIKSTDNVRQYAKEVINTWTNHNLKKQNGTERNFK